MENIVEVKSYCLPVSNFLASSPEYHSYTDVWNPYLKVSYNVATQASLGTNDFVAKPFDDMQKQTPYMLVKYNPTADLWEIDMLDLDDAEFFLTHLKNHEDDPVRDGWEVVLYSLEDEIIQEGPGALTIEKIRANNNASLLIAQAKFFNGIADYTPLQEKMLQKWISQEGTHKMRKLYNDIIVAHRSDRLRLIEAMDRFFT
jgi:hypothetical protein